MKLEFLHLHHTINHATCLLTRALLGRIHCQLAEETPRSTRLDRPEVAPLRMEIILVLHLVLVNREEETLSTKNTETSLVNNRFWTCSRMTRL